MENGLFENVEDLRSDEKRRVMEEEGEGMADEEEGDEEGDSVVESVEVEGECKGFDGLWNIFFDVYLTSSEMTNDT